MNFPHQILCDYLEDKGIDTRLLRTQEPDGIYVTDPHVVNYVDAEGLGAGENHGFGHVDGDGFGFGFISHELYESGSAYANSYAELGGDGFGTYFLTGDGSSDNCTYPNGNGHGEGFYLQ